MKYLGIDYGTKRIGIAISDEAGTLAFAKEILHSDKNALDNISEILRKEKADAIVVGESVDQNGVANIVEEEVVFFVKNLENKFKLPVYREKEFFTSLHARGEIGKKVKTRKPKDEDKKVDSSAAALILQRYLDRSAKLARKQRDG